MKRIHTTACPRNCYSTCTMNVTVEDGRILSIEPYPGNLATPEGVCLKGLSYIERVYDPDRLLHPMRRRSDRDGFEPISWEVALDEIAERLTTIRERYGPRAILYYAASGTKGLMNDIALDFWKLFGGCTTTYGDLCWPAGLEATRLTLGDNKHNAPWDLANARLIILWGKNPAETNIHQMRFVEQAIERGGKLIVIDPRRTQSAEAADLLVQIRPGTDGALALGIAHQLIEAGSIDSNFIDQHVLGFAPFAAMVADYPPERVAKITDLPAATVHRLAEEIASGGPVTISAGFGMQRYTNSAQTMRSLIALVAITGNLGKPGAGWVYANLQSQIFGAVKDPLAFFPPDRDDGPIRVSISTALLGRQMSAQTDPPLRMAWVERGNPITQNPNTNEVLAAFRALDFRVVVDQFLTDTAREADIVLPAKTMFEQTDVINAYWHPYIQIKQKLIDPPGEVKPESEIYYLLARRLGLPPEEIRQAIPAPSDAAVEAYLRRRLEPFEGLSLERLRNAPISVPGHQEIAWSDLSFPTPSGKIELLSEEAAERWGTDRLPRYREPSEVPRSNNGPPPHYPLHLLTPNSKDRIHSQFNNLPSIRQLHPRTVAEINPIDAGARGIEDGSRIRVFNDRGAIEIVARIDHGIRQGSIAIANGWWLCEGGGVNQLSCGRETDMAHGAAFHENAVEIEPLP